MGAAAASLATVGIKAVAAATPDPIYDVIEQHRKAAREHLEAVRTEFAFEEAVSIKGERREEYEHLYAATGDAWDAMDEAAGTLVNTQPTTLAGILALCRYIGQLFEEDESPDLPEFISYDDDDTQETPTEALCHTIGAAVVELMKGSANEQCGRVSAI
jgi:hypothetical protein